MKVSVRTATEEGESPDPQKLIILNPREFLPKPQNSCDFFLKPFRPSLNVYTEYPDAPMNVKVQRSATPPCLVVQWTPSKPLPEGNPIDGYAVYLNTNISVRLGPSPKPVKSVSAQVFANDLRDFKDQLLQASVVSVTVCAVSGDYQSAPSLPVVVAKEDVRFVYSGGKMTADESEITSSATSLSSIEDDEEKEVYSPAAKGVNGRSEGRGVEHGTELSLAEEVEAAEDVSVSNGVRDGSSNGTLEEPTGKESPQLY